MTIAPVVQYYRVLGWQEDHWLDFCNERRRVVEGTEPDQGLVKTAKQWNISVIELQHLILESGHLIDEGEKKDRLAKRMLDSSEMAIDLLVEKFESDLATGATTLKDAAAIAKQTSDAYLNLKNGTAQAQNIVIEAKEVKALIALNKSMPDTFVPISFERKPEVVVEEGK